MEPLVLVLVPGLLGGIVVALIVWRLRFAQDPVRHRLEPPSPGLINMAHIRPEGAGGLGMVAMAVTVAIFVPAIRFAMATALLSGIAVAAVLIAMRRRNGPLSSGNDHPGAHSIFGPIDEQRRVTQRSGTARADRGQSRLASSPA
jgi:hypothetical protein